MSSQQSKSGVGHGRGDYETPDDLYRMLEMRVGGFDLDAAADRTNAKAANFCAIEGTYRDGKMISTQDGLQWDWGGGRVWLNPPYTRGHLEPFMEKCARERNNAACIVALIPVATDTNWWHKYVRPYATIHYLRGRVKFLLDGVVQDNPPGAVCVAEFLPDWLNGENR